MAYTPKSKTFHDSALTKLCGSCKIALHGTIAGQWTYSKPLNQFYHTNCFVALMSGKPPLAPPNPAPNNPTPDLTNVADLLTVPQKQEIQHLVNDRRQIDAIRATRKYSYCGLFEAKNYINSLIPPSTPIQYPPVPPPAPVIHAINGHDLWIQFVHAIRPIVDKTGLGIAASPRFAYAGAKYLARTGSHLTVDTAMSICDGALFEGLSESVISKLRADIRSQAQTMLGHIRSNGAFTLNAPFDTLDLTIYHTQAKNVLTLMQAGLHPFLHGAPGAGKTHLAMQIATDAGLGFVLIPCSPDMLRSEVLGTRNPLAMPGTPSYQPSAFFDKWVNGGIIMFDECGNAPGSFLNLLNSALAQGEIRFPNGEQISKHKNCYIIFADNSNLWGDDPKYPERQDAGSAFRNRLYYVKFDYDTTLETRVVNGILGK